MNQPGTRGDSNPLERALREFEDRLAEGDTPDIELFVKNHGEAGDHLRSELEALLFVVRGIRSAAPEQTAASPRDAPDGPATIGGFEIVREIGRGGMGVVYEARQAALSRTVALKVLPPGRPQLGAVEERFRREARALAQLQHPGIVNIHEVGESAEIPHFAMELIEGAPLDLVLAEMQSAKPPLDGSTFVRAVLLHQHRRSEAPASRHPPSAEKSPFWAYAYVEAVCWVLAGVADALHAAHEAGIVHRDVKPSNILVRPDGSSVLTDFGIAFEEGQPGVTETGELAGTLPYLSPEQVLDRRDLIGPTSDVFSLGVTLYEALCLRRPFDAVTPHAVLNKITSSEPPSPRLWSADIPRDLEAICLCALQKRPGDRYSSAAVMADDLRRFLECRPVRARPVRWSTRIYRFARRRPQTALAGALALLLVVGGPLLYAWQKQNALREVLAADRKKEEALQDLRVEIQRRRIVETQLQSAVEAATDATHEAESHREASQESLLAFVHAFRVLDPSLHSTPVDVADLVRRVLEVVRREMRQPEGKALALNTLGILITPRDAAAGVSALHESWKLRERAHGALDFRTLRARLNLVGPLQNADRHDEAVVHCEAVLHALGDESGKPDAALLVDALNLLGNAKAALNDLVAADFHYSQAMEILDEQPSLANNDARARLCQALANLRLRLDDAEGSEAPARESVEIRKRIHPFGHVNVLLAQSTLARCLSNLERFDEAEPLFRQVIEDLDKKLGLNHSAGLPPRINLGWMLHRKGEHFAAMDETLKALPKGLSIHGPNHPVVEGIVANLSLIGRAMFDELLEPEEALHLVHQVEQMYKPERANLWILRLSVLAQHCELELNGPEKCLPILRLRHAKVSGRAKVVFGWGLVHALDSAGEPAEAKQMAVEVLEAAATLPEIHRADVSTELENLADAARGSEHE